MTLPSAVRRESIEFHVNYLQRKAEVNLLDATD